MADADDVSRNRQQFIDRPLRDQQAEAEANRLAIEELRRNLPRQRLRREGRANQDSDPRAFGTVGRVLLLVLLIATERGVTGNHGSLMLSLVYGFVAADILVAALVLRPSRRQAG
jgi:hypothetical protein